MISNEQTIIEAANIEEVISDFVPLQKKGVSLVACCPFHNEKTPSFNVNPARGIFKCFGCGKGGDSVTFVMQHEKLTYPETLEWLAKKYSIKVEYTSGKDDKPDDRAALKNTISTAHTHFYFLPDNPGRKYFQLRGFTQDTLEEFGVGYCDSVTVPHVTGQELQAAGIANDRGNCSLYGRAIIPIRDHTGTIVSLAGRAMEAGAQPKYLNGAETSIYSKSKTLFGLYENRKMIEQIKLAIIVEGYTDVMMLRQSGCHQAVGTCGTALTVEQCKLLARHTENAIIIYDGDEAGRKAAHRAALVAFPYFSTLRVVLLEDGQDPDEYLQKAGIPKLYNRINRHWIHAGIFYCTENVIFSTETGKKTLGKRLHELLKTVQDETSRAAFIDTLAAFLGVTVPALLRYVFPVLSQAHETAYKSFRAQFAAFDNLLERRAAWCVKMQEQDTSEMNPEQLKAHTEKIERVEAEIEIMDGMRTALWAVEELYISHIKK